MIEPAASIVSLAGGLCVGPYPSGAETKLLQGWFRRFAIQGSAKAGDRLTTMQGARRSGACCGSNARVSGRMAMHDGDAEPGTAGAPLAPVAGERVQGRAGHAGFRVSQRGHDLLVTK